MYGITADELHIRIVEAMRQFGHHMNFRIDDILDRHEKHPLEQTITSVMLRIHLERKTEHE